MPQIPIGRHTLDNGLRVVLSRDPRECTGNAFIDDEVLAEAGITDLSAYAASDGADLQLDLFVDGWPQS